MENINIGKTIQKLRKVHGLNQKAFGEKIGYAQRTVSDWECGNTEPNIEAIIKIARIFDISYEELLEGGI